MKETVLSRKDGILSKYHELEKYMPRQIILAHDEERKSLAEKPETVPGGMRDLVYERLITSVKTSSMALRELARLKEDLTRENQEFEVHANEQISSLRDDLGNEKSRVQSLGTELKALRAESLKLINDTSARIQELEVQCASLSEELGAKTRELDSTRGILNHLAKEVAEELNKTLEIIGIK